MELEPAFAPWRHDVARRLLLERRQRIMATLARRPIRRDGPGRRPDEIKNRTNSMFIWHLDSCRRDTDCNGPGIRRSRTLGNESGQREGIHRSCGRGAGAASWHESKSPFAMKNADGSWTGISVELWKHLSDELNLEYELQELSLEEMLMRLEAGQLDAAVAAISATSARHERVGFCHPHFSTGLGIAVSARERATVRDAGQLARAVHPDRRDHFSPYCPATGTRHLATHRPLSRTRRNGVIKHECGLHAPTKSRFSWIRNAT